MILSRPSARKVTHSAPPAVEPVLSFEKDLQLRLGRDMLTLCREKDRVRQLTKLKVDLSKVSKANMKKKGMMSRKEQGVTIFFRIEADLGGAEIKLRCRRSLLPLQCRSSTASQPPTPPLPDHLSSSDTELPTVDAQNDEVVLSENYAAPIEVDEKPRPRRQARDAAECKIIYDV